MRRLPALIAAIALIAMPVDAAKMPESWDGLMLVKSKRLENVYLLPGADFRIYTKVMLDPPEVSFRKNWQRDTNNGTRSLARRVSDRAARDILDEAQKRFQRIFAEAFQKAGFEIVSEPGEDVLRVSTALVNLDVQAPESTAARTYTFTREAGQATVLVQAKDSLSGQLLGRAVDAQLAGDNGPYLRNRSTNIGDFEDLFTQWAKHSVDGIALLKTLSPVEAGGLRRR
ncbi:MAG TPA: DUF3313 family protein [Allosphingosinicella sp.]|jgi:hypothetical protein|nr:DUF3313 family protein [Allosphingosinicella sp.]